MQRLINIIGKAPSELSFTELITKLTQERNRVRQALEHFRTLPVKLPKKAKNKTTSEDKAIKNLMNEGQITKSKILELIQQAKKDMRLVR